MRGLPHDAAHRSKRHLLRQHQNQRFEQQREAIQPPSEVGLDQAYDPLGSFTRGVRTSR